MRPRRFQFSRKRAASDGASDAMPLLADLIKPVQAPDLAPSIMGRLGYMRIAPAVTKRRRIKRAIGRACTAMLIMLVIGAGMLAYEGSSAVRRPMGLTIPAALGNDLQLQQQRLDMMIRTIRSLSPQSSQSGADTNVDGPSGAGDDDADSSEDVWLVGPMRWV